MSGCVQTLYNVMCRVFQQRIEAGGDLIPTAHPFDVTSLVKQFFRELPDPLLTFRLHDTFLRCFSVESEQVRHMSLLLTCHLLPAAHMSTLRFTMHFLQCVAAHADSNKMDLQNLAVCMAPNLLYAPGKGDRAMAAESRLLQQETGIIQLLMERADALGMVSDSLCQRTALMTSCCFPSDDELERSEFDDNRVGKKKKRSGSFQGDLTVSCLCLVRASVPVILISPFRFSPTPHLSKGVSVDVSLSS